MNDEQLTSLGIDPNWINPLNETFERFDINTPERQAAFIGQCGHESGGFKILQENLNYSAEGLQKTWPKRFPTLEDAQPYARQPEKIANKVYAGRNGNGDEASGEGWRYRGRGCIQLTGKANYNAAGDALGVDFLADPDVVATPQYAALTAGWFWFIHDLNSLADARDDLAITKKINGGTNGLDDRIARTQKALDVLKAGSSPVGLAAAPPS
jgi:putative chitinase